MYISIPNKRLQSHFLNTRTKRKHVYIFCDFYQHMQMENKYIKLDMNSGCKYRARRNSNKIMNETFCTYTQRHFHIIPSPNQS